MNQFEVVGRNKPTVENPKPELYRMKVFGKDEVGAKSRFWFFLSQLRKMKRSVGEVVAVHRIAEKNTTYIKNYGVWIRYDSRSGTHNVYKEYRDLSLDGAVNQMFQEMASRHRARRSSIRILRAARISGADVKRDQNRQFLDSNIKFPMPRKVYRAADKRHITSFKASRPSTIQ